MRRDMGLMQDILRKIEGGQNCFEPISTDSAAALGIALEKPMSREEADRLSGHLDLLEQEGLIEIESRTLAGVYWVKGLTWRGHKFLERGQGKSEEMVTLKPTFMGMSINLKEVWRRAHRLWKKRQ